MVSIRGGDGSCLAAQSRGAGGIRQRAIIREGAKTVNYFPDLAPPEARRQAALRGLVGPGTARAHRAATALGPSREARPAAVKRQQMGGPCPLGPGYHSAELIVNLVRVLGLGESEPLGHAEDMGVDGDRGDA